jgi:hypothetical protein
VLLNEFLCRIDRVSDSANGLLHDSCRDALYTVGDRLRLLPYAGSAGGRRRAAYNAGLSTRASLTRRRLSAR